MSEQRERIVVAMSGGVDSSVAALLLVRAGYEVIGISMRLWSYEKEAKHGCCTPEDLYDARRVADQLGIPHYVNNFEASFETHVISNFVRSYSVGETPNPCVRCNQDVKFDVLLRRARELGATYLATGHYARRIQDGNVVRLLRGADADRDQSYFLYGMGQEELSTLLFPLGELTKQEVRKLAREEKLAVADKPDSQEICFVPAEYTSFIEKRLSPKEVRPGPIVDEKGKELGQHGGIHEFTIGQRKGLGLNGTLPQYVLAIEPTGQVIVGAEESLWKSSFRVREPRWVTSSPNANEMLDVKIRSRFSPAPARITEVESASLNVLFLNPQRAITPGQAAVFYRGDEVVGGGWIDSVQ